MYADVGLVAEPVAMYPLPPLPAAAFGDFWADTPWLHVPESRRTVFAPVEKPFRGRLLGGSAKPSKLAALAAKRKMQQERKVAGISDENQPPERAISLLDRLGSKFTEKETERTSAQSGDVGEDQLLPRKFPIRKKRSPSPETQPAPAPEEPSEPAAPPPPDLRADPSVFAKTMLGSSRPWTVPYESRQEDSKILLPAISDAAGRNPFSDPSPDDLVLQKQSKGRADTVA